MATLQELTEEMNHYTAVLLSERADALLAKLEKGGAG